VSGPAASPPRFLERDLCGWGRFPLERCRVYQAHRVREVRRIVGASAGPGLIARGLGRSYGDAALNVGGAVMLNAPRRRLLAFDAERGLLECEAGASLRDIVTTFLPRGFFPAVTPGTADVTVGGAIAADVHGKNHHRDGSFSRFVEWFTLVTAAGAVVRCSRQEHAELFAATVGGMGLSGVILDAGLRLMPVSSAWVRVEEERAADLDRVLERLEESDQSARYSVGWIDTAARGAALGRCVLMRGEHAEPADLGRAAARRPLALAPRRAWRVPRWAPGGLLKPSAVRAFNAAYWASHRGGTRVMPADRFFHPLDGLRDWNRLYGRRGFVQHQCVLERAQARTGVRRILEELAAAGAASYLSVIKRFGPAGEGLLSFARPGVTLALDLPNTGEPLRRLVERLDRIVLECGGRVYLAKDALLGPETFAAMYPEATAWRQVKDRVDPQRRFASSLARRVGLVEAG
jgi:FAD/FMN-containing dehydrogenase